MSSKWHAYWSQWDGIDWVFVLWCVLAAMLMGIAMYWSLH